MKIIHYCQHVLGIGHFFRSMEIARALWRHQVTLVTGGPAVEMELPENVTEVRLPGLGMDVDFASLFPIDEDRSLPAVQEERRVLLYALFEKITPDIFIVELFPFGRKRFGFELLPILKAIRRNDLGQIKVVCSLRDILVEKDNQEAYEQRVLKLLQGNFDALLVHADPTLVSLAETFGRAEEIRIPTVYTGFVTRHPHADDRADLRSRLGIGENDILIVASAGGGKVGAVLLKAVLEAHCRLAEKRKLHLHIFTGPFMSDADFTWLANQANRGLGVRVERFTKEFVAFLAAADLSISMAGYNTCMNILAARVPALVWPFGQNREQRLRAERLAARGGLFLLADEDLSPARLEALIEESLEKGRISDSSGINLDGAAQTARWLESWLEQGSGIL